MFDICRNYTVFYIHNLNFDGNVILNFLPHSVYINDKESIFRRGDMYSLVLTNSKKCLKFVCSAKIFPMSLEEIGPLFNIGSKMFFDHSLADSSKINDIIFKNKVITYCSKDVLLVVKFLEKINFSIFNFVQIIDAYSISGLSLKIFKNKFNVFNIELKKDSDYDKLFRPAYYGGRCEVFGNLEKDEDCYHFDFSGMYTNRLMDKYPYGEYIINSNVENLNNIGFYYVTVRSDMEIPILPFRDETTGKLLFPNGVFSGLYWWEELILFKNNGGEIIKIDYSIEFSKEDYVFKDFAEMCDNSRKKSIWEKVLWKLIPNSFIGRMGIKSDEEETLIISDENYDPRNFDVICDRQINDMWVVRIRKKVDEFYGNVIYPAIITSKARILWWNSSKEVIKNNGRLLYCDTDSIFAAFKKDNSPLGLKHGEVYWDPNKDDTKLDDACFVTAKVYCINYKDKKVFKIKGISKKYIKDYDLDSFKKAFFDETKESFKTLLFEKKRMVLKIREVNKIIDFGSYDKRIFNSTKTRTTPIIKYPI